MLRIANLNLPLSYQETDLLREAAAKLRIPASSVLSVKLVKRSVDARDKGDVHFVITLDCKVKDEAAALRKAKKGAAVQVTPAVAKPLPKPAFSHPPVVIGAGPAGLFAALTLAKAGACPVLLERGKSVEDRTLDVEAMMARGELDEESNVQFGEGGAGAFSDGKLTTGIKSPHQRTVLETFVAHGAPEDILYEQKPHIGTDKLKGVVASMRREIIALGGKVLFSAKVTELILHGHNIAGVIYEQDGQRHELMTDTVLLAIGHSARNTMQTLFRQGVTMEQKPFAIGVRIEHPQSLIDRSQYGRFAGHPALKAAPYKLAVRTPDERGVYTFCMCPGGQVIPAASQQGGLAVNGMSYYARDMVNANAALLVGVRPDDFGDEHPLAGFVWQRSIEQAAFRLGGGDFRAPVQRVEDFLNDRASKKLGDVTPSYLPGVTPCDLRECLPKFVAEDLKLGIRQMDRQLHGFAMPDAVMTGVETRSSSPVRLPREADGMARGLNGLFPVGEGAGYAGGIVSAAVDGISAALKSIERSTLL